MYEDINDGKALERELYRKEYYQYMSKMIDRKTDPLKGEYLKASSYQSFISKFMNPYTKNRTVLNMGQPGCHPKGVKIRMADGSLRECQNIKVGEHVSGVDGSPREVLELLGGYGEIFKINTSVGKSFLCNDNHILSLYSEINKEYLDISVKEYLHHSGIGILSYKMYIQPFLGGCDISDSELRRLGSIPYSENPEDYNAILGSSYKHRFKFIHYVLENGEVELTPYCTAIISHVGEGFSKALSDIALSVGIFTVYEDFKIELYGENLKKASKIISESSVKNRHPSRIFVSFSIEPLNYWDVFYGMRLSDDNKYMLDSGLITHNSGKTLSAIETAKSFIELYKIKYDELSAKIGDDKYAQSELEISTPSVIVLGASGTISAFINELLSYSEYGFITDEEKETLKDYREKKLVDTDEFKLFFNRIKQRITNKKKGGFFLFYGYQMFINRLFIGGGTILIELEKILNERIKNEPDLTLHDLLLERVASGEITINNALLQRFENSFLICDESHNTYNSISKNNYGVGIQYILDNVPSLRAMFMSATPISNSPTEIVEVISYLSGEKIKKSTLFSGQTLKQGALNIIRSNIIGKISYIQDSNPAAFPDTVFNGDDFIIKDDIPPFRRGDTMPYIKAHFSKISQHHKKILEEVLGDDNSYHKIPPSKYTLFDGVFPTTHPDEEGFEVVYTGNTINRISSDNSYAQMIERRGRKIPTGEFLKKDEVSKWFPKLKKVLEILDGSFVFGGEKCMIVHPRVALSGILLIQELLIQNGYIGKDMIPNDETICSKCGRMKATHKDEKHIFTPARFLMAYADMDKKELNTNIELFNQPSNVQGHVYKIFVGSKIIMEQYTLKEIQHFIVCGFPTNFTSLKQFMGRAIRKNSHERLPENQKKVNIHILINTFGGKHSPEEYKYIDKMITYLDIQQIEKVMHEEAIDASINRSIIMPPETKKAFEEGKEGFNYLYFDESAPLKEKKLSELNLTTYYAYRFYNEEIQWITFIIKRLFCINPVWKYDDLLESCMNPPFGVEFNTRLISEGNFVRVLISLTQDNLFCNIPTERKLGNSFDVNHSIIIKNGIPHKIEHVGDYFILFEFNFGNNSSNIFYNSFLSNVETPLTKTFKFKDYIENNQKQKQYENVLEMITSMFEDNNLDEVYLLTKTTNQFQEDLVRDIIQNGKKDKFFKWCKDIFERLEVLKKNKYIKNGKEHIWNANNNTWTEDFAAEKNIRYNILIGYIEDVDYYIPKFKIKKTGDTKSDRREEERGMVCETKNKEQLLKYADLAGIKIKDEKPRVKNICNTIAEKLVKSQFAGKKIYFKGWWEKN